MNNEAHTQEVQVGLIGLGAMGQGMASSLRRAGYALRVYDIRAAVAEDFAQGGGLACATPAEVACHSDVLVSVVVNAAQTEEVLFGAGGCAVGVELDLVIQHELTMHQT